MAKIIWGERSRPLGSPDLNGAGGLGYGTYPERAKSLIYKQLKEKESFSYTKEIGTRKWKDHIQEWTKD